MLFDRGGEYISWNPDEIRGGGVGKIRGFLVWKPFVNHCKSWTKAVTKGRLVNQRLCESCEMDALAEGRRVSDVKYVLHCHTHTCALMPHRSSGVLEL